jgi:hypothetical protein
MGTRNTFNLINHYQTFFLIVLILFMITNNCFGQRVCQNKFEINSNGFLITRVLFATNDTAIEIPACIDNKINMPIVNYQKFVQQNFINAKSQTINIPKPTILGGISFVKTIFQQCSISVCENKFSYDAIMFADTQLLRGVFPAQLIFGMELFSKKVITLDFENHNLSIADHSNAIDSNLFYEIPSKFVRKKQDQTIFIKVNVNNKDLLAKIDIGYNGFLIGNNSTFKKINLPISNQEQESAQIVYLGGNDSKNNKVVKNVTVLSGFKKLTGTYYVADKIKTDLNLGVDFLKQFEMLIIDDIIGKVYIKRPNT